MKVLGSCFQKHDYDFIDVPILGSDQNQSKEINRSELNSIIKPRVEETLELARQKLIEYNINRKPIRNLVLTGGGALLKNIDKLITKETGLPVVIAEDPLSCVAIGTGKALDQEETFSTMLVG